MSGHEALEQFLTTNKISKDDAAKALKVSRTALYYWLTAKTAPGEQARADIEVWTRGKVPAGSWGPSVDHRKEKGDVEPFEPKPEPTEEDVA